MALDAIQTIALIIAVVTLVKLVVLAIKPKAWLSIVKPLYSKPIILMVVALILSGIILNYLLAAGITITQIFAVFALMAMLMLLSLAVYTKEILALGNKMLKDRSFLRRGWVALVVWAILSIWVIKEIFVM